MSEFWRQAGDILETAAAGREPSQAAIMIDRSGGIRILDGAGWSPEALAAEFGAETIFQIRRNQSQVRVEGWNGAQHCSLRRNLHIF
ncbi:MAG TPA: hypothetical protein VJ732_15960 [Bryobacteraceae bacterium]|nr:hypothetical protein [Bryobacteraceae bacterium]